MSILSDDLVNELFDGTNFGDHINSTTQGKRDLLAKTITNCSEGYWSGHTAYHIAINSGLLMDGKKGSKKRITVIGREFLRDHANSRV